ncbi:MAG: hypothetical protein BAA01_14240 [Bacillus thermozeamaize]|uniref:Uncharacterized protein n=1 Tax=Bacillus thermozeamaize TaxID=230954 RepID=A0A1Y3PRN7_9BACI|nr:MAG: hypothetical protein BAA01_14240 [Bacillus thermozeamaize]
MFDQLLNALPNFPPASRAVQPGRKRRHDGPEVLYKFSLDLTLFGHFEHPIQAPTLLVKTRGHVECSATTR